MIRDLEGLRAGRPSPRPYLARLLAEAGRCLAEVTGEREEAARALAQEIKAIRARALAIFPLAEGEAEVEEIAPQTEEDRRWSDAYNDILHLAALVEGKAGMRAGGYLKRIEAGVKRKARKMDIAEVSAQELEASCAGLLRLLERTPQEIADAMDKLLRTLKGGGR